MTYLLQGMRSLSHGRLGRRRYRGAVLAVVGLGSVTLTLAFLALRSRIR